MLRKFWGVRSPGNSAFEFLAEKRVTDCVTKDSRIDLGDKILRGRPLSYSEYHLALALGFLISDLDYVTFFKTRWHETSLHMAYGPAATCELCQMTVNTAAAEKAEKHDAGT